MKKFSTSTPKKRNTEFNTVEYVRYESPGRKVDCASPRTPKNDAGRVLSTTHDLSRLSVRELEPRNNNVPRSSIPTHGNSNASNQTEGQNGPNSLSIRGHEDCPCIFCPFAIPGPQPSSSINSTKAAAGATNGQRRDQLPRKDSWEPKKYVALEREIEMIESTSSESDDVFSINEDGCIENQNSREEKPRIKKYKCDVCKGIIRWDPSEPNDFDAHYNCMEISAKSEKYSIYRGSDNDRRLELRGLSISDVKNSKKGFTGGKCKLHSLLGPMIALPSSDPTDQFRIKPPRKC